MKKTAYRLAASAILMIAVFAVFAVRPAESLAREKDNPERILDNAWSNLHLHEIDFKKAGLREEDMKKTLARVCSEFTADPQKNQFLVREIYAYDEFRDLYMSSSKSVRKRVDVLLPKVLENIFMGKESVTQDISLADKIKGAATYLANKKKMKAFSQLRYNEDMMRRMAFSIYKSMGTEDPELAKSLETLFVTVANKKKYKLPKKTALHRTAPPEARFA